MTNLQELFEVFNGQDIDGQFTVTLELIRKCRKERFVSIEDEVKPFRNWIQSLQEDKSPYRVTFHSYSIALPPLQLAFKENRVSVYISVIGLIKSEMMGCASAENFQTVKELYTFWDDMEMTLQEMNK